MESRKQLVGLTAFDAFQGPTPTPPTLPRPTHGLPDGLGKRWASLALSHIAGEAGLSFTCSPFCCGRSCRPKVASPGTRLRCPVRGRHKDSETSSSSLQHIRSPGFYFFFPQGCARTSALDSHKGTLICGCCQNQVFFEGQMVENLA